jgi:hypothetical protein
MGMIAPLQKLSIFLTDIPPGFKRAIVARHHPAEERRNSP